MDWADVLALLRSVEWGTLVRVLLPVGLMAAVFSFLVGLERRKAGEIQRFLEEGREVLRKIEREHEQASWLLGRMKEKIEERRRRESLKDCEFTLDRIVSEERLEQGGSYRHGVTLDEARKSLGALSVSARRASMVELVNTPQGVAYLVPREKAGQLEGMRKERLTQREIDAWARKCETGDEIPF